MRKKITLTNEQKNTLVIEYKNTDITRQGLAIKYGVHINTINNILKKK